MHTICITDLSKTQVSSRVKWLSKAKYQHVFWVKGCFFSQRPRDKKKGNSCHHTLIKISFSFWRSTSNIYIIVLVWVLVYLSVYFLCSGFDFLVCISCCILYILWLSGSTLISLTCVWPTFLVGLHGYLLFPHLDVCVRVCFVLFCFLPPVLFGFIFTFFIPWSSWPSGPDDNRWFLCEVMSWQHGWWR